MAQPVKEVVFGCTPKKFIQTMTQLVRDQQMRRDQAALVGKLLVGEFGPSSNWRFDETSIQALLRKHQTGWTVDDLKTAKEGLVRGMNAAAKPVEIDQPDRHE